MKTKQLSATPQNGTEIHVEIRRSKGPKRPAYSIISNNRFSAGMQVMF